MASASRLFVRLLLEPEELLGLAAGSHIFQVRATDPAHQSLHGLLDAAAGFDAPKKR